MKILLVGEFSGVHTNLAKGLRRRGHSVTVASDGDWFKGFSSDLKIQRYGNSKLFFFSNLLYFFWNFRKYVGYDIVQFVSPFAFPRYFYLSGILHLFFRCNGPVVFYSCGTDPAFNDVREKLTYHPLESPIKYSKSVLEYYNWFLDRCSVIVPATYSYGRAYESHPKLVDPIKLPGWGRVDQIAVKRAPVIRILFGVTRPGFKGAADIETALKRICETYPDRVRVTVVNQMAFSRYKSVVAQHDVLLDQTRSYFYGMNAILALEHGLIVMSGAESVAVDYFSLDFCPVVNIRPNPEHVFEQLEKVINMSETTFSKLKRESYLYASMAHDPDAIAAEFDVLYSELNSGVGP